MNILFVCSRNQWRSPTAEAIYMKNAQFQVRSAGTEPSARIRLTLKTINWADVIFVMEKKHKDRMAQLFGKEISQKQIIILDISDDYQFMDEELVDEITSKVNSYLKI